MAIVGAVVCGAAITRAVAATGYNLLLNPFHCGGGGHRLSRGRVKEVAWGIALYRIDNGWSACPSRDNLIDQKYIARGALVDPWGTSITFHCMPGGDVVVRSAGPDHLFHTNDDITNGRL